jgi:hypothetical protein
MATETSYIQLTLPAHGEFENTWEIPVNQNFVLVDRLFAPLSTSGGHAHTGVAGQGPQILHASLFNAGVQTHAQIDAHIATGGLHSDTKISSVSGDHGDIPGNLVTVTDVTTIKFTNATVVDEGSGVIMITAAATAGTSDVASKPESAPITWVDNFNWPSSRPLSMYGWAVQNSSTPVDKEFMVMGPTSSGSGDHAELALIDLTDTTPQQGYVVNHCQIHLPHGITQRVTLDATKLAPSNGFSWQLGDDVNLNLDLLSANKGGDYTRPALYGLSLQLRKPNGSSTVSYSIRLKPHEDTATFPEVTWTDFSGNLPEVGGAWQNLAPEFMIGIHEFSLRKHATEPFSFYLNYYYNGGMVFTQLFTDGNPLHQAFVDGLQELQANLAADTTPKQPVFGRMGFSVGWSLPADRDFDIWMRNFSATSQDDLDVLGIVALADDAPPPPPVPVCATGEFTNVFIGDEFDFDGPTTGLPSSDWIVNDIFPTGNEGSQNSDGFYVENRSTGSFEIVWCDPAVEDAVSSDVLVSRELNQTFEATGINLPTGDINEVDVEYFFATTGTAVPVEWEYPAASGGVYAAGAAVPSTFLNPEDVAWDVDGSGKSRLTFTYSAGNKLPWGAALDAKVTARFEPFEEVTFPNVLSVVPGVPSFDQVTQLVWDDFTDPVNPVWVSYNPGNSSIPEGSTIFIGVAGPSLPLGDNFWSEGFGSWGFSDADGASDAYSLDPVTGVSPLWDRLAGGVISDPVTAPLVGYPPDFVASPGQAITTRVLTNPGDSRMVATSITRLAHDQYSKPLAERGLTLSITNPNTGEVYVNYPAVLAGSVIPRPPMVISQTTTPSPDTSQGAAVGLSITGKYFDDDPTIVLGATGWASPNRVYSPNDPDLTYTNNPSGTQTITVANTLLSSAPSTVLDLELRNTALYGTLPAIFTRALVDIGRVGTTLTPLIDGTFVGGAGALVEDRTVTISVKVKDVDIGAILTFTRPGQATPAFFRINSIYRNPVPDPFTDFFEWSINVTTTELSGSEGSLASTVLLYLVQGNGKYVSTSIPVTLSTQPSLDGVGIDSPYSGSNNVWNISSNDPVTREIFFETTNATYDSRIEVVNPGAGGLSIEEPWEEIVAGQRYKATAHLLTGTVSLSEVGFTLTKPSRPGATLLTNTLNPAIQFVVSLAVTSGPSFDTPPTEGHYSLFSIPGVFIPADGVGSNLLVEFLDTGLADIVHVSGPVVINSASTTTIVGSVRFADDTSGKQIVVRVSHTDIMPTPVSTLTTAGVVTTPVVPTLISASMLPPVEGTTGTVLTINGAGLIPPTTPVGRTPLTYTYSYTSSGAPAALSNIVSVTNTATQLVHTADITAATAGQSINLAVNYLGGNTATFNSLAVVTSSGSTDTDPLIGEIQLWNAGTTDFTVSPPTAVTVRPNGTAILRVTGSGLNSSNVDPATGFYMEVVGEEYVMSESPVDSRETAPGPGLTNDLGSPNRYEVVSLTQQTDDEILAIVPATMVLANLRSRVRLDRPAGHPDGAGTWDLAAIDDTGLGALRGLPAYGTTFRHGDTSIIPRMNVDQAAGITQVAVSRSLQTQMAPGFEDGSISITIRLQAAQSTLPTVFSIPDVATGADFSNIQVSATANPFEYIITADLPDPGVGNTLDSPYDEAQSAYLSLRFSTGHIIAGGRLGATDWGSLPGHISF